MDSDEPLPKSIVECVYKVVPPPVKKKSLSSHTIVKIEHVPKTEFARFPREDHHYKAKTKYLESQIKKDLLSKRFWLLRYFNTPQPSTIYDNSNTHLILQSYTQEIKDYQLG